MSLATTTPPLPPSNGPHISPLIGPPAKPPPTPEELSRQQRHTNLENFGKSLQLATRPLFPNTSKSRYSKVSVLLLSWETEDPQLPVSIEIKELADIFQNIYGFETELWTIPEQNCHARLNRKILDFVMTDDDPRDHLLIAYYAGHATLTADRLLSFERFVARFSQLTIAKV